jgi:cyclopropane-fatty-acyl-phospholipid synthase
MSAAQHPSLSGSTSPGQRIPAAARLLLAMVSRLAWGRLTVSGPDGFRDEFGGAEGLSAHIEFRDWAICGEIMRGGDNAFAEGYMQRRWESPDLIALLTVAAHNQQALDRSFYGSRLRQLVFRLLHAWRSNTRRGARRNIEAHYDLGNDFYQLWLDPTMTYSSALFGGDEQLPLADAQRDKYRRILRELGLRPGQHVLEIGCGWGGFAEEALRASTVRLTGLSLSPAQTAFANARLQRAGLANRAELVLRDYRDERGTYDAVASIEMFEAVGERYWPAYFSTLQRVLRPGGRAVIQAITIAEDRFERYRTTSDFIQQYIFPGGMLATRTRIAEEAWRAGLRLLARHDFGADYARTLKLWLKRFDQQEPSVRGQGFDTRFIRMWRFYLAYCAAGFIAGTTDVGQYTFARA